MARFRTTAAAGAVSLLAIGTAAGQVTYTAQTRTVTASMIGEPGSQTKSAPDFGPFSETVSVYDQMWSAGATASQDSLFDAGGLDCTLAAVPTDGLQTFGGVAESIFDVSFTLDQMTAYELTGSWNAAFGYSMSAVARATLTGPGGTVFDQGHVTIQDSFGPGTFGSSGSLPAGAYRLVVRAYARGMNPTSRGDASAAHLSANIALFGPACEADLTGDGLVDFSDYLVFLNLYDAQDLRVDYTGDGFVDFSDYLAFLNFYDAGC